MRRMSISVAFSVIILFISGFRARAGDEKVEDAEGKLLDRVVAVIEGDELGGEGAMILLLSDLILAVRVDAVRVFGEDGLDPRINQQMLKRVINEELESMMIFREAVRFEMVTISDARVRSARDELASRIGGPARMETWLEQSGIQAETLDELLRRRLVVEAFIKYKRSEVAPPEEDELKAIYSSGQHPYVGKSYAEVREQLKAFEHARRKVSFLREWIGKLRKAYRIRVFEN